jgi:fructuronate reductase
MKFDDPQQLQETPVSPQVRHPVRLAHLGLGAFHRAHQAWYTQSVNNRGGGWGIASFSGRSPTAAVELSRQDCRYSLIFRGAERDTAMDIESIVAAHDGADSRAWLGVLADPEVSVLTLTVTEAGYLPGATPPVRLVEGLRARRAAGSGGLAVVSCDNLLGNGGVLRAAVLQLADVELATWITENISFVSTMVDRITPATSAADRAIARDLVGWDDRVPVVTEPFTEWVLQGEFPVGRPPWHEVGARFVDDIVPYEKRKLWFLNAGHSLLAYRGLEVGYSTVFEAWSDPILRAEVEQLWSEARDVLELSPQELDAWLATVRVRWDNPRIEHRLEQIATGGAQKISMRIRSVATERQAAGLPRGTAGAETIAAWERYKRRHSK